MAHVRTQIRDAFKAVLVAALDADYDVFASRKYKLNMVDRPMVDMRFASVDITAQTMGDLRTHTGSLFIRVQRMATGDDIDDLLDQDEVNVTAAIEAVDWSSLLEEDPELKAVSWADDADGEVPIGMIVLRYDIEYRIAKNDPETMRS
jgi:esterase/lipase superfamily enzyme